MLFRSGGFVGDLTTEEQRKAARLGDQHSARLMGIGVAHGNPPPLGYTKAIVRMPSEAVEAMAGFLSDGSPISVLLDGFGIVASEAAKDALVTGLAQGHNPRRIAQALRQRLGVIRRRAETIARTETIRAYRTATLENYRLNADVVDGWVWRSSRDRRTCPVCLALDGSEHTLDEAMGAHPSCRCSAEPRMIYWKPERKTGEQWLREQPESVQREKLGPSRFEMFQQGIPLTDMVTTGSDPRWGPFAKLTPLREMVGSGP